MMSLIVLKKDVEKIFIQNATNYEDWSTKILVFTPSKSAELYSDFIQDSMKKISQK